MRGKAKPVQAPLWAAPVPDTSRHRLLRQISQLLDLAPAVRRAEPYFSATGRPSIPVEQMLKAMLLGCLFGIASDRQLVEACADSLAFRDFLGLAYDQPMFVHASFTHWRQRLGPEYFREFVHEVVRQCQAQGMKLGHSRTVDASTIKAQADRDGPVVSLPRAVDIDQYFQQVFTQDVPTLPPADDNRPVNRHDPAARLQRKGQAPAEFAYQGSFSTDPDSGLITDATATPLEQPATMVDHVDHDPGVVRELVADSRYDDALSLRRLQARGVTPYVPRPQRDRPGQLSKDEFTYDPAGDCYRCPEGCILRYVSTDWKKHRRRYAARASDCARCPQKSSCTASTRRWVDRHGAEVARQQTVRSGPRYRQLMARRRTAEHYFRLAKRDHGMTRARGLGLAAVRIQVALTAVAIDLKKLVRFVTTPLAATMVGAAARDLRRLGGRRLAPAVAAGTTVVRALARRWASRPHWLRRPGHQRQPTMPRLPVPSATNWAF
jgi:transposase